ncbi:hypothetical protein HU200_036279 [Digitaria exilis]|uniref:KIB1-4 beta-propeller domain-containing protein n=1 Tax=Digitaria exilis TaxID=1010633 RepID=A0A835ENG8_9POAL|nr:hypothetical protein HU200_036279 [Digitaria exilis]
MAPPWADLTPDLLIQIAHRLDDLKSYVSARGACKPWRRALVSPFPALLVATEDEHTMSLRRPTATSLATRRKPFQLAAISSGCRCVGSTNGWLALCIRVKHRSAGDSSVLSSLAIGDYHSSALATHGQRHGDSNCYHTAFFLVNPVAGLEIELPPLFEENRWISKLVFAPARPTKDDFAAVAICNGVRIIYVTARATSWAVHDFKIEERDQFVDLVYHGEGNKVYCLTRSGDVHVLHLPKRRLSCRQKPAIVEGLKLSVLRRPPKGIQVWSPNRLYIGITLPVSTIDPCWKGSVESSDLNAPATVEPLLSADSYSFSSATAFAPPYAALSAIIDAKYLVFCEGNLYQVWRNTSCTVNLRMPGVFGRRRRVNLGEMFVLRYYPDRWPCWDVVKDLGGYSFFVGKNNAVSLYAKGMPGLRGNCVYWIDRHGREKGTIFDVQTGRSTPCQSPEAVVDAAPHGYKRTISFWYFLSDAVTTNS